MTELHFYIKIIQLEKCKIKKGFRSLLLLNTVYLGLNKKGTKKNHMFYRLTCTDSLLRWSAPCRRSREEWRRKALQAEWRTPQGPAAPLLHLQLLLYLPQLHLQPLLLLLPGACGCSTDRRTPCRSSPPPHAPPGP